MASKKQTRPKRTEGTPASRAKKTPHKKVKGSGPVDRTARFERLLKTAAKDAHYVLKLYVTGSSLRSGQAIFNIRSLCDEYLKGRYDLEVIDIYQQPEAAVKDQIIAAPTLVKRLPVPLRRIVGDLSDRGRVLLGLNLHPVTQETPQPGKTQWLKV